MGTFTTNWYLYRTNLNTTTNKAQTENPDTTNIYWSKRRNQNPTNKMVDCENEV